MTDTLVRLTGVSRSYKRGKIAVDALRDLDLTIDKGDFLALMGPSGSGKTTLLNLIGGIDRPTEGRVEIGGVFVGELSESELAAWRSRHVGFVFQFYNLLPILSARRNVELPLLLTKLSAAQRRHRAEVALEIVGLEDRADHKPAELSGGQQQRVAIARALVPDPEILVCDEPTGDLDRESADEILAILQTLNRDRGKTIVMVTHDPRAAEFATHRLSLDKGRLVGAEAGAEVEIETAVEAEVEVETETKIAPEVEIPAGTEVEVAVETGAEITREAAVETGVEALAGSGR